MIHGEQNRVCPYPHGVYHLVAGGGWGTTCSYGRRGAQASPLPTSRCSVGCLQWPPCASGCSCSLSPCYSWSFRATNASCFLVSNVTLKPTAHTWSVLYCLQGPLPVSALPHRVPAAALPLPPFTPYSQFQVVGSALPGGEAHL